MRNIDPAACRCLHWRPVYVGVNVTDPARPVTDAQLAEGLLVGFWCPRCQHLTVLEVPDKALARWLFN